MKMIIYLIVYLIVCFIVDGMANDFGALLRFTYFRYVRREKVIYSKFTAGTTPRTKRDKALYNNNYDKNRIWCAGFLLILAGILGICFS